MMMTLMMMMVEGAHGRGGCRSGVGGAADDLRTKMMMLMMMMMMMMMLTMVMLMRLMMMTSLEHPESALLKTVSAGGPGGPASHLVL